MIQTPSPTLLLTGATGFLGLRLAPALGGARRVVRAARAAQGEGSIRFDLQDGDTILRAFDAVRPAAVVHAGAVAGPDECELDPARARRINRDAVMTIAGACARARARLVFISTDLVFDGEKPWSAESERPNPRSVYGRLKLEAEEAALAAAPGAVVLRVSSMYGRPLGGRAMTVDEQIEALSKGRPVSAFTDQWRTSTDADQLAEVVGRILDRPEITGLFHWGGADRVTRFEAARILCGVFGFDPGLVRPARAAERTFAAPRPRDTSLDSRKLAGLLGIAPRPLAEGFAALKAAAS